jgi:hypothetical protein
MDAINLVGSVTAAVTGLAITLSVGAAVVVFLKQRGDIKTVEVNLENTAARLRQSGVGPPSEVNRPAQLGEQQYVLLRAYHAQGLAQSKISFWFSLIFASIGFSVIMLGVGLFLSQDLWVSF